MCVKGEKKNADVINNITIFGESGQGDTEILCTNFVTSQEICKYFKI